MRLPWNRNKVRVTGLRTWWGGPVYMSREKYDRLAFSVQEAGLTPPQAEE